MKTMWTGLLRRMAWVGALVATVGLTGCGTMYVDASTPEVPASEFKRPNPVRPVQAVFEFQTKGVANAQATAYLKERVMAQLRSSGLFSTVSEQPAEGGALLSVTLNNVPLTDDAFSKGFVTGLTFGLAGSKVTDGYVCQASYSRAAGVPPVVKQARHAIHTTMGASAAPGNAIKADSPDAAVTLMTRQVISQALRDLAADAAFQ